MPSIEARASTFFSAGTLRMSGDEDQRDDEGDRQEDVDAVLSDEAQGPRVDGHHRRNLRSSMTAPTIKRTLDDVL